MSNTREGRIRLEGMDQSLHQGMTQDLVPQASLRSRAKLTKMLKIDPCH
jgi:hypothetical protein